MLLGSLGVSEFVLYLYVTTVGFVCAGVLASLNKLITGQPLSFVIQKDISPILAIPAVLLRVFGGPFILTRNSIRGALIENRSAHWLFLSIMIATFWSFFSGAVVIETFFTLKF